MSFHGAKRRRSRQGPARESADCPESQFDDELHRLNYEAADRLRSRILSEFSLESHQLPERSHREHAALEVVSRSWKARPPPTHGCLYCALRQRLAGSLISSSESVSLLLEGARNCILEDQLLLVPNSHVQSTLYLDEQAYTELRNYQKTLVYMFQQAGKCVIFVETSLHDALRREGGQGEGGHCRVECFPVPVEYIEEARGYFLKALDEMGSAWSQNKRLAVSGRTGVRGTIPQGFDFIHVDFSLAGEGMARVIEDPGRLRHTFARSIVAGVLNKDQLERAFRDSGEHGEAVRKIRRAYAEYDWTVPRG